MKKLLLSFVILLIALISYGLYEYYRPPASLKDKEARFTMSSFDLKKQVEQNPQAVQHFGNDVILVEGIISSQEKAATTTVMLDSSIRCELDHTCSPGNYDGKVRIKGLLAGYDDFFGEVLLVKCQIEESENPEE